MRVNFGAQSIHGSDIWNQLFSCLPAAEQLWFTGNIAALTTNFTQSKFVHSCRPHPLQLVGNALIGICVLLRQICSNPEDIHCLLAVDTDWDSDDIVYFRNERGEYV